MKRLLVIVVACVWVAGCARIGVGNQSVGGGDAALSGSGQTRPQARPGALRPAVKPPAHARTVEQFDTTSAAEKTAAAEAAKKAQTSGAGRRLGVTVASLGDPAEPGLWMQTPLVTSAQKERVVYPANGKAVELELIPIDGPKTAGSRMSLAALRVIEAPLTDLPEVEVWSE